MKPLKEERTNYLPLLVVVGMALAMALAVSVKIDFFLFAVMNSFMGFFLCLLSLFKLFNLSGFVQGFAMYDVITKRIRLYGYVYPFIELALGLLYLANALPLITNSITVVVMTLSAIGVIKSVFSGMNLRCACLGTVLNVPLSTVSIVENVGMGVMAAINVTCLLFT